MVRVLKLKMSAGTSPCNSRTDSGRYKMNHKRRGMALIFNHEYFLPGGPSTRSGTNKDRDKLSDVLIDLGFEVDTRNDLHYNEIYSIIQDTAQRRDHSRHDCLLIAVLTHGERGGMLHAKDVQYNLKELWQDFTDEKCPKLAGKPKLFFIQACRGDLYDDGNKQSKHVYSDSSPISSGSTHLHDVHTDADGSTEMSYLPNQSDFLFAFSTKDGYFSWRHCTNGSWFIQSLCDEMAKNATRKDILTWLTSTCNKVATEYKSNPNDPQSDERNKRATPTFHTTLTRQLVFTKKKRKKLCFML